MLKKIILTLVKMIRRTVVESIALKEMGPNSKYNKHSWGLIIDKWSEGLSR